MALAGTLLPIALAIIMFGLGLSLAISDFRRVAVYPKAAVVALSLLNSTQMAIPAATYGVLMFFTAAAAGFLRRPRTAEPILSEGSSV